MPSSSRVLRLTYRVHPEATCLNVPGRNDLSHIDTTPMRFCDPTTLVETSSDLHWAYLTQLCYAFRLSQSLDASFRSRPARPCFMPVTPLGFDLQRCSLRGSCSASRRSIPSCCFPDFRQFRPKSSLPVVDRSSKGLYTREVRIERIPGFPKHRRPSLSWQFSPPRYFPSALGPVLPQSLLSWAYPRHHVASHSISCALFRVSKNRE